LSRDFRSGPKEVISNVKVQSSNEVQIPKFKWQTFDIQLTFACLPVGRDFDIWHLNLCVDFNISGPSSSILMGHWLSSISISLS
jgi:hypothetical protein